MAPGSERAGGKSRGEQARAGARRALAWAREHRALFAGFGLAALAVLGLGAGSAAAAWARACVAGCPGADQVAEFEPAQSSEVYDAEGELLGTFARERRRLVSLDDLPPHLPLAFVAIEDQRFFRHDGVDVRRFAGAVRDNIVGGFGATGFSTITMQLARDLFPQQLPRGETTIRRKVAEVRLAMDMERNFTKGEILELYLNNINLGAGAYGVEAAARTYFGKPAAELTYVEAATLAGLPQAPSRYNPRRNPELAEARRNRVLAFMERTGVITPDELEAGIRQPLTLAPPRGATRAPYVYEQIRRELEERFGEILYTGGLRIHTSIDPRIQEAAERQLEEQLVRIEAGHFGPFRHPTYETVAAERAGGTATDGPTPYLQGVAVVLDAATGEVVAMVGGRDFSHSQYIRAVQARRQPGSAFKPFVYAAAMEAGRSPLYRVSDERITMVLPDGQVWTPRNYAGQYGGMTTLREGLRNSYNMVAIRLGMEVGLEEVRAIARRMGVLSPIPAYPSVFIGAGDLRPIEAVAAYAPLANGGMRVEPRFIRRIEDHEGRILWEPEAVPMRALDPGVAWLTTDMLREVVDRGTGYPVRNPQVGAFPYEIPAAGKTGTTNDATDVWFIGYTPDLVGGVWIGMDRPQTIMPRATGGTLASPVWARIMRTVYEERPVPQPWSRPGNVVERYVDAWTGRVTTPTCPYAWEVERDFFLAASVPQPVCEAPTRERGDPTPHLPGRPIFPDDPRIPPDSL